MKYNHQFLEICVKDYRDGEETEKAKVLRAIPVDLAQELASVLDSFLSDTEKHIREDTKKMQALEHYRWLSGEEIESGLSGYNSIRNYSKHPHKTSEVRIRADVIAESVEEGDIHQARYSFRQAEEDLSRSSIWRIKKRLEEKHQIKVDEPHGNQLYAMADIEFEQED